MITYRYFLSIWMMILTIGVNGYNQSAHVHGKAFGSMVIGTSNAIIEFRVPAQSVIGFEYKPKTTEELLLVETAKESLSKPNLITLFKNDGWLKRKKEIQSSLRNHTVIFNSDDLPAADNDAHDHEHDHHEHDHHSESHNEPNITHSEFIINHHYSFNSTSTIDTLSTDILSRLPNVHELSLTVIVDERQFNFLLNHDTTTISLTDI